MIEAQTHIGVISRSLEVLRELLEIDRDQWCEMTLQRAHAHLYAIHASEKWLAEWCAAKSFVQKVTA